jgi:hypothetical protein
MIDVSPPAGLPSVRNHYCDATSCAPVYFDCSSLTRSRYTMLIRVVSVRDFARAIAIDISGIQSGVKGYAGR